MGQQFTIDDRERILIDALRDYLKDGYFVQAQTPTTAQLMKRRPFDVGTAVFSSLLCGVGLLVYIAAYFARPYDMLYLAVDENGQVYWVDKWSK